MRSRTARGQQGSALLITALLVLAALITAGLVVDLGQLRVDRRIDKGTADVAARAGVGRLAFGPWSGVCKARDFLLANGKAFSAFDAGTETWSNVATPPTTYGSTPCTAVASAPDAVACGPNNPATWAKLQATALSGRFTIEIQAGYVLPDSRFPSDATMGDTGATQMGSCDNLSVIITERQGTTFGKAAGSTSNLVTIRSVGRLNATETLDFVAALQLLEMHACNVLQTGGATTRVVAQPYNAYPGTIQIDSAGDSGTCPSPILNAQATSSGPSVLACSANSTTSGCRTGTGTRPSRVGIYAVNFNKPTNIVSTAYPSTYGDTQAVGSPRTGRKYTDLRYRANIAALDADAKSVLTGNSGKPPGCTVILLNACTGNGVTWLVLQSTDCATLSAFFLVPGRTSAQNIWFNCDVNVTSDLTLTANNAYIVVTGQLAVNASFTISDPRKVYIGGKGTGSKVGLDLSGSTSSFIVDAGGASDCAGRTGAGHSNRLVVGTGSVKVASGATVRLCQTTMFIASGYDKVPTSDGVFPCTSGCSTYNGTISISSGSTVDLSAPNEITGRLPSAAELANSNPFEDLGLWMEAGGNTNSMAGGASTRLTGVFFLPNADAFNLAGGGSLPIDLSAQFVSTSLKVTGGATVNLVPNPEDSIPVTIYTTLLVR